MDEYRLTTWEEFDRLLHSPFGVSLAEWAEIDREYRYKDEDIGLTEQEKADRKRINDAFDEAMYATCEAAYNDCINHKYCD